MDYTTKLEEENAKLQEYRDQLLERYRLRLLLDEKLLAALEEIAAELESWDWPYTPKALTRARAVIDEARTW